MRNDYDLPNDVPTGTSVLIPITLATAVAMTVMRRWHAGYEERTKADVRALADQHHARTRELDQREKEIARRELEAARVEGFQAARFRGVTLRLDDALNRLALQDAELVALQRDYAEITSDYNLLVEATLRDGHQRFTAPTASATGSCRQLLDSGPRRSPEHQRDLSPVTRLTPREHQSSV